jgi:predicted Rossmann-fold nucleotide-binding protein
MARRALRGVEIDTPADLEAALARVAGDGHGSMAQWQVQDLDLRPYEQRLRPLDPRGALVLGCAMSDAFAEHLRARGALVFPALPDLPFDPWRNRLYTPQELYDGLPDGYGETTDALVYAWSLVQPPDLRRLLAASLHDSSIDDALDEYVDGRDVVGVMGGHAMLRSDPAYAEAAVLGHDLAARGLTVATGGGPGAMEAANLGARLADEPRAVLDGVVRAVAAVPDFADDVTRWAGVALDAVADLPDSGCSLGIPTWHYGHEPPNPFASASAKYFRNAIREDVLLHVCRRGVVFLPGAAGTVQEIFQAACTNYYAPDDEVAPMVFVGRKYWTRDLPAWPLVSALAAGRRLEQRIAVVDDTADAVAALLGAGRDD